MSPFRKGNKVRFRVARGEHNMLAGRPGVVEGRQGRYIVVRCTEEGTVFNGETVLTPRANLRHA
jgi:hypothetical protein